MLHSIVAGGYEGEVFPVNKTAAEILGLRVFPSLEAVPGSVDLIVVVVPAGDVPAVLRQAAEKEVACALILTAGFREAGHVDLEDEIKAIALQTGMRLIGPNVQGLAYLPNKLCAVFWPVLKVRGTIAVIGQSGTVTAAIAEWAERDGIGISGMVNLGNQADICDSEVLEFFGAHEGTRAIALYLEAVKDGRGFQKAVRAVCRKKPVFVLKSGRSVAGRRATASHTASLAGSDRVFDAACRQFGAVRVDHLHDLYDAAKAGSLMRIPGGRRLFIISSSGGSCALAADEAERAGLTLEPMTPETLGSLRGVGLSLSGSPTNPWDLASVSAQTFAEAARAVDELKLADTILMIFGDPVEGAADAVKTVAAQSSASVCVAYYAGGEVETQETRAMQEGGVAVFPTPDRAVRAIGALLRASEYLDREGDDR